MKKLYFSILTLILATGVKVSNAQTLTVANHVPVQGDLYKTADCTTVGIVPGAAGAGMLWSFTTVTLNTVSNYTVATVPASLTALYANASVAAETGSTATAFYSSTANNLFYWGGNIVVNAYNVNLNYSSAAVYAIYPMSYGAANSNTIAGAVTVSGLAGTFAGTCNITADGTGTIALPARTFTNVLRIKTVQNISFTISGTPGTLTQTYFDYYSPGLSKIPLFTIATSSISSALGSSSQTVATANADYATVGVQEFTKEVPDLSLYPNPAKGNFNLSFTNENAENSSVEIINSIGQVIRKQNLGSEKGSVKYNINLDGMDSGFYFVKVYLGSSVSVKKITTQ